MKKYFICADVHGDLPALKEALNRYKFDFEDKKHILVVAGDCFDRGRYAMELYKFLRELENKGKAIVLMGNHEPFFIGFLEDFANPTNYFYNGLEETVDSFLERTRAFQSYWYLDKKQGKLDENNLWEALEEFRKDAAKEINGAYPELLNWLKTRPDYLELKKSVITHGMVEEGHSWRTPKRSWKMCHWATPRLAAYMRNDTDKHIYVGHINTDYIREYFGEEPKDNTVYTRPAGDVTYLDGCTALTSKVPMVVVEDEEIDQSTV